MSAPGAVRPAQPAEAAQSEAAHSGAAHPEAARSSGPARRRSRWDRRLPSSAGVWWLSPIGAVGLLCPLTILVSWQTPDRIFQADYKETKAVTGSTVLMATVALLAFAAGAGLTMLDNRRPVTPASWPAWQPSVRRRLRRAEPVLFALTMAGYVLFAVLGVAHGLTFGLLVKSLVDQDSYSDNLTDVFGSVTGLTSFTQVGMAYSVVAMFVLVGGADRRVRNRLVFLLLLALLRSYLVSERLAVIEVLVPIIAIGTTRIAARGRGRGRRLARGAPLLMFPALFGRGITITNNSVTNSHARGIDVVGGSDVTISGNTVTGTRAAGIMVAQETSFSTFGAQDITITDNTVSNAVTITAGGAVAHGAIMVDCADLRYPISGVHISGNTVTTPRLSGFVVSGVSGGPQDIVVDSNVFVGPSRTSGVPAFSVTAADPVYVRHNTARQPSGTGFSVTATGRVVMTDNEVHHGPASWVAYRYPVSTTTYGNRIS